MTVGFQPFVLREQYVKVACDLKNDQGELVAEGFWIECRQNLSNGEREILIQLNDELQAELKDIAVRYTEAGKAIDAERATLAPGDVAGRERLDAATVAMLKAQAAEYPPILRRREELIAKHIRAWNLFTLDENDQRMPVPAPKDGGIAVLEEVTPALVGWMLTTLLTAYRSGFGIGSARSAGRPEPMNVPDADTPKATGLPSTRRSRPKSASPSV